MPTPGPARSWYSVLGWACYLACSWTWCIGMFLPALLIRDYGPWSFVVFAVPNVIGAAAMGWVLRRPGHAELLTAAHGPAARLFSWVTIAFQAFFLGWANVLLPYTFTTILASLLFVAIWVAWRSSERSVLVTSAGVFLLSIIALLFYVWLHPTVEPAVLPLEAPSPAHLPYIGLVCVLGFSLCPYLDLTFLRARTRMPGAAGTMAFVIGFGLLFSVMIGFTYLYSPQARDTHWLHGIANIRFDCFTWLAAHIFVQLLFTIAVHSLELDRTRARIEPLAGKSVRRTLLLIALPLIIGIGASWLPDVRGLSVNELIYRLFMGFYGLVFPAYVWLCMLPFRPSLARAFFPPLPPGEGRGEGLRAAETLRHGAMSTESADNEPADQEQEDPRPALSNNVRGKARFGASPRAIAVWAIACVLASPFYYLGFVERVEIWLIPGVAIVLLAKLLIPPSERGSWRPPAEPKNAPVPVRSGPPGLSAAAQPER